MHILEIHVKIVISSLFPALSTLDKVRTFFAMFLPPCFCLSNAFLNLSSGISSTAFADARAFSSLIRPIFCRF